jgi:serine/threonine protein kinase
MVLHRDLVSFGAARKSLVVFLLAVWKRPKKNRDNNTAFVFVSQKPDNLGFTLDGTLKLLDFGLARMVENAETKSNELYAMSGETGSLRYMAPGTTVYGFPLRKYIGCAASISHGDRHRIP